MKEKRFQVFIIDEVTIPCASYPTLDEAIEDCRRGLFKSIFTDEMIIQNSVGKIIRRYYWQDFNSGGKMFKPVCPKCGSKKSIPIIYGYPTPPTMKKAEKGLVKLGGCEIGLDDPVYFCRDCEKRYQ